MTWQPGAETTGHSPKGEHTKFDSIRFDSIRFDSIRFDSIRFDMLNVLGGNWDPTDKKKRANLVSQLPGHVYIWYSCRQVNLQTHQPTKSIVADPCDVMHLFCSLPMLPCCTRWRLKEAHKLLQSSTLKTLIWAHHCMMLS